VGDGVQHEREVTLSPRRIFQCLMSFSAAFHPIFLGAAREAAAGEAARDGWPGGRSEWWAGGTWALGGQSVSGPE